MDASVVLHLKEIGNLAITKRGEFTPIGEIVSHLIAIVNIQEHRISALEVKEVK